MSGIRIAAIGPVTGKTIEEHGLKVDIQPQTYTIPDLVDAIAKDARPA
jgi:uroporphyrinogen III methyltransferase/synthase